jgi:hypothetical protein
MSEHGPRPALTETHSVSHRPVAHRIGFSAGVPRLGALGLAVIVVGILLASNVPAVPGTGTGSDERLAIPPIVSNTGTTCNLTTWQSTALKIVTPGCYAQFLAIYNDTNLTHSGPVKSFAFGFALPWIAEITANDQIVRLATQGWEVPRGGNTSVVHWSTTTTSTSDEVNITLNQTLNITGGSGWWNATTCTFFGGTWGGCDTNWNISNRTFGTANLSVTFHLLSIDSGGLIGQSGNGTFAAEFDIGITGWHWADPSDRLGIAFGAPPEKLGPIFEYNQSSEILSEEQNDSPFASVFFGGEVGLTYPGGGSSTADIADQVEIAPTTFAPAAIALLTFEGAQGGYSALSYDPWVEFSPDGVITPPPGTTPHGPAVPSPGAPGTTGGNLEWALLLAGAGSGAVGVGVLARRRQTRRDGEELVAVVDRLVSEAAGRPPPR